MGPPVTITITANADGTVDVVGASMDPSDGLDLARRMLGQAPARERRAAAPVPVKVRRKAPSWTCPRCGNTIGVQGRVSHERRHEREDAEAAAAK